jgi:hypothetical protein
VARPVCGRCLRRRRSGARAGPGRHVPVSGSGGVAVGSFDSWDQRGHFGIKFIVWLWLWRWLGGSKDRGDFFVNFLCRDPVHALDLVAMCR